MLNVIAVILRDEPTKDGVQITLWHCMMPRKVPLGPPECPRLLTFGGASSGRASIQNATSQSGGMFASIRLGINTNGVSLIS